MTIALRATRDEISLTLTLSPVLVRSLIVLAVRIHFKW